ncbi:hypothetical protein B0H11DRAFT_1734876 [Mycena galericulata]|nr:hypothetical protein B0H11DRAFT_1734876 [Mycena galericulata]
MGALHNCIPLALSDSLFTFSIPAPMVDEDRYVFALLAGGPRDPTWPNVAAEAATAMEAAAQQMYGPAFYAEKPPEAPRRGSHHAASFGESMGGGQETPSAFYHSLFHTLVLARLLTLTPFKRIIGFVNAMFISYAPKLHDYYGSTMDALHGWDESLPRFLQNSVFAAATFNFGPRTVTLPHLDFANLAWGWCAITALGDFDPNRGGHLILWDLRLVIRFPPGSTIFIPSALLRHSNVAIQQGEKRFSFTQYTAAGIFRFVYNKFRTEKSVKHAQMSAAEKAKRAEQRKNRWFEGLKMLKQWEVAFE